MSLFSEQLASLVGPAYVGAFFGGTLYGLMQRPDEKLRRTRRLLMNNYINNIGKTGSRFGNNAAAAVLLYIITGKMINFIFQEEFDDFKIGDSYKPAIYGGVTGALYKSTRGTRPMLFAAVLGAGCGSFYNYLWTNKFFIYK